MTSINKKEQKGTNNNKTQNNLQVIKYYFVKRFFSVINTCALGCNLNYIPSCGKHQKFESHCFQDKHIEGNLLCYVEARLPRFLDNRLGCPEMYYWIETEVTWPLISNCELENKMI